MLFVLLFAAMTSDAAGTVLTVPSFTLLAVVSEILVLGNDLFLSAVKKKVVFTFNSLNCSGFSTGAFAVAFRFWFVEGAGAGA